MKSTPKDTKTFTYYNANPKNKETGDCVIRALSLVCNIPYYDVLNELVKSQIKSGYMINDSHNWSKFLKDRGFVKLPAPRTSENKRIRGEMFCQQLQKKRFYEGYKIDENSTLFIRIGSHHVVGIKNFKIHDIWDSTDDCVGQVWLKIKFTEE